MRFCSAQQGTLVFGKFHLHTFGWLAWITSDGCAQCKTITPTSATATVPTSAAAHFDRTMHKFWTLNEKSERKWCFCAGPPFAFYLHESERQKTFIKYGKLYLFGNFQMSIPAQYSIYIFMLIKWSQSMSDFFFISTLSIR